MLFNSLHFIFFLPIVIGLYYALPYRFRWLLIFVASCYFYMAFVPAYILILFAIILIDYIAGLTIERLTGWLRKFYLVFSIVANVSILAFFKYFNFFNDNLAEVFHFFGGNYQPSALQVLLPIGLSFHTFQSMSYTIEVYRGRQKAERHLGYFANYVLFFPQMVAGPIERYERLGEQLKQDHDPAYENFARGFKLILFGLFVKMAIADNLAPVVNQVYENPAQYSSLSILVGMMFFSFQIYADFYGYSTIAVGSAALMGINIMDNFKTPYLSKSIGEFWQRWHISLSTWFRDYLYIPLGGNKVGVPRWCFNILLVFLISGLWHGASWTFVIWGALHGLVYLVERFVTYIFKWKHKKGFSVLNTLFILKNFLIVTFIWVFFRAESFEKAELMFKSLFANISVTNTIQVPYTLAGLLGVFILSDLVLYNKRIDTWTAQFGFPFRWAVYAVLIFFVMAMGGVQNYPFIYFQF